MELLYILIYKMMLVCMEGNLILINYKFTTSVITTNLLNTKYIDHLSRLKNDNILNSGRNIVFSLQFNL